MTTQQFTALYREHHHKLYYFMLTMARNREQAEDATSRAFVAAWEHREQLNGNFKPWLYQIAVNEMKTEWRKKSNQVMEPLENHLHVPAPVPAQVPDQWQEAAQAVVALPRRLRSVMRDAINGLDLDAIARARRIPYGTAASRLYYAREKVRELCQA